MPISPDSLTFLRELADNNDRDWFQANKDRYEAARQNLAEFAQEVMDRLSREDMLETPNGKKALYRIYRDVRFSKDKSPYKTRLAGHLVRAGRSRRGGYYFSIEPNGQSMIGGGFYGIERDDLKRVREEFAQDAAPMRNVLDHPDFKDRFGEMQGDKLKTAPKGYDRDHPAIDLLRYKHFYAARYYSDEQVTAPDFIEEVVADYAALRPFFDYFSEVLTTDANGESVL